MDTEIVVIVKTTYDKKRMCVQCRHMFARKELTSVYHNGLLCKKCYRGGAQHV